MNFRTAKLIYFSPTRTTKTILEKIGRGLEAETVEVMDLTAFDARSRAGGEVSEDLAVFGIPVYAGRVPQVVVETLTRFKAQEVPCAIVVVYGNREFDDALLELKHLVSANGFIPIAGGAFIGEHSFSTDEKPIAPDRPHEADGDAARKFGGMIREKLLRMKSLEAMPELKVPGNYPYREHTDRPPIAPITRTEACTLCGECEAVCPTQAIEVGDRVETDAEKCIICCACIKGCPEDTREMTAEPILQIADWLYTNYSEPKKPEVFF